LDLCCGVELAKRGDPTPKLGHEYWQKQYLKTSKQAFNPYKKWMPQKCDVQLQTGIYDQNRQLLVGDFHKLLLIFFKHSKASTQKRQWFFSIPHEVFTFKNVFLSL
jgi:hypothetical protein